MRDDALYHELGLLTNDRDRWSERIPYVSSLLIHESVRIRAKALWLLGEMGLRYPAEVQSTIPAIVSFLDSPTPILRERAVNALGRIGRLERNSQINVHGGKTQWRPAENIWNISWISFRT